MSFSTMLSQLSADGRNNYHICNDIIFSLPLGLLISLKDVKEFLYVT